MTSCHKRSSRRCPCRILGGGVSAPSRTVVAGELLLSGVLVGCGCARPALVVSMDPIRVEAARLRQIGRELLETDDVDDRVPGRDERDLAAELGERGGSVARPLRGATFAFEDEAPHR